MIQSEGGNQSYAKEFHHSLTYDSTGGIGKFISYEQYLYRSYDMIEHSTSFWHIGPLSFRVRLRPSTVRASSDLVSTFYTRQLGRCLKGLGSLT